MVMDVLQGVELKLVRAREHLDSLYGEIGPFIARQVARMDAKFDPVTQSFTSTYKMQEPLPATWGLMVGDAVHNTRSALDNLVTHLVLKNGAKPGRHNSFPIYTREDYWLRDVESRDRSRGKGPLHG